MESYLTRLFSSLFPNCCKHISAPNSLRSSPNANLLHCTPQGLPYTAGNYFINKDNQYLYAKTWHPKEDVIPKAIVFISHGIFEHCLCYEKTVAKPLTEAGYVVVAHDHIGHGQSEGDRAMVKSFSFFVRDVIDHVEKIQAETNQNLPIFILGHSMGGVIALFAAIERPKLFQGVILNGIAYHADPGAVTSFHIYAARFLACVCPSAPLIKLALEEYSSDPVVIEHFRRDPYRHHGKIKARLATQFLEAIMLLESRLTELKTPIFLAHGTLDKLASPSGSQYLYDKLKIEDKELMFFDGCFHQIHWEPNGQKEHFVRTVINWIAKRT